MSLYPPGSIAPDSWILPRGKIGMHLWTLESTQLLRALVLLGINQCTEGLDHLGHLRYMVAEVVHESDEMEE